MTKKFVSLVLSLALVIGLLPIMSVSAESRVVTHFAEDFESWSDVKFNDGFTWSSVTNYINSAGDSHKTKSKVTNPVFSLGYSLAGEVVSMEGYDGTDTKAFKIEAMSDASRWPTTAKEATPGGGRFNFMAAETLPTTGIYVQELKVFIPADTDISHDIYRFEFGPIVKVGDNLCDGANATSSYTACAKLSTGWNKITAVSLLDSADVIIYLNDECVGYKKYERTSLSATNRFQVNSRSVTDWKEKYLILDDYNIYSNPNATTVSSVYSDASGLSKSVSPVVTFSESVLDYEAHSDGRIVDKVELIATSGATPVDIDIDLSTDGKTLTIDPKDNLASGKEYTVKLTGLVDMYGREITDTEFNFTTAEASPITVSQPVFTKENLFAAGGASQTITALENGYIKASATVSNSANTAKEVMVLSMLKEGEDIKYFQFDNLTVPAKGSAAFTGGFQIDNASTQKIETVVWDNITNKTPLADKYAFSASGYVKTDLDTLLGE